MQRSPKTREPWAPESVVRRRWMFLIRKRENLPFLCVSVPLRSSLAWMMPSTSVRVDPLTVCSFKCWPPSHTHPEVVFDQLSGNPLAQSSWHVKVTIIPSKYRNILCIFWDSFTIVIIYKIKTDISDFDFHIYRLDRGQAIILNKLCEWQNLIWISLVRYNLEYNT